MAYIGYMENVPMTVVEMPSFLRRAKGLISDEERAALVAYLAANPESGAIMAGTGGVRKMRWAREGEGKSGGYRVIHYFHSPGVPLFALLIFSKNEQANLTQSEKNDMKRLTAALALYGRKQS